jgi:hypothetical protein
MTLRDDLDEYFTDSEQSVLLADGFDDALIGFSEQIGRPVLAVYAWNKMIDILVERDGMDLDDALDFLEFNVVSAWMGEGTPIIVKPLDEYL